MWRHTQMGASKNVERSWTQNQSGSHQLPNGRQRRGPALKELPEDPGEYWSDVAETLVRHAQAEVANKLFRPKKDSDEIIH
jgi:hypothetical protein